MLSDSDVIVREASTPAERRAASDIRHRVFVEEQGIPEELDRDGLDADARHVLLFAAGQPVATGRFVLAAGSDGEASEAILARIAVLPSHRGGGLGRRVVALLEAIAREAGARQATLHPHHYLEAFYASMGYRTVGGVEQVGPCRLLTMTKAL